MHSFLSGMKARTRGLRYGFLLVPGGLVAGFAALAFVLIALDRAWGQDGAGFGVANDPDAARTVLTVIAGSLATITGVTFSITMVTLQLVSQQFSPRALRRFLGDRLNQAVAGVFVGVFVYALLVLRTVEGQSTGERTFVPAMTVTVAIALAVMSLILLLIFIDHMGRSIQVSSIAAKVAQATLSSLDRLYPAPFGRPAGDEPGPLLEQWRAEGNPEAVHSHRPGYIQSVTIDDLPNANGSPGLRIHIPVAPGDFVTEATPLAEYWPGEDDGDIGRALALAIVVANERDMKQDPGYGIRQLADIATRAISPGINDPTTAWTCIAYLQAIMEKAVARSPSEPVRRYEETGVTIIAVQPPFEAYVDAAYVQVGRYATDPRVAGALLDSLAAVVERGREVGARERTEFLLAAAPGIRHAALDGDPPEADRRKLDEALQRVHAAAAAA